MKSIFDYYKKFGYKTIVMGASFRSVGEITELAGCDYLTISVCFPLPFQIPMKIHHPLNESVKFSILEKRGLTYESQPNLLEDMMGSSDPVPKKLDAAGAKSLDIEKKSYIDNEADFRFDFNEDQMGVEKLREGISKFAADAVTLKDILKAKIEA